VAANLAQRVNARAAGAAGDTSVTEIAQRQKPLTDLVREMEPEFRKAAPKGVEAVQVVRDVLTAISVNPKLKDCQPLTVLGGAMTMAQLGLRVNVLGHGWLIPFYASRDRVWKAQLIIGYKGLSELVGRSGLAAGLGAHAVHAGDRFRMGFVDGRRVVDHEPDWFGDRGEVLGWYAAAQERGFDTWTFTEPWSVARMEAHRDRFAMAKKDGAVVGPWRDHFESMAKKTVLLDLIKLLPKSTDVVRAVEADNSVRVDLSPDGIDRAEQVVDGEVVDDTAEEPLAVEGGEPQPPAGA
jgi:recombination protein RecT